MLMIKVIRGLNGVQSKVLLVEMQAKKPHSNFSEMRLSSKITQEQTILVFQEQHTE